MNRIELAEMRRSAVTVEEFADEEFREEIKRADMIRIVDKVRDEEDWQLIWGREFLEKVIKANKGKQARIITIKIDWKSDELEYVLAAVGVLRGYYWYNGEKCFVKKDRRDTWNWN